MLGIKRMAFLLALFIPNIALSQSDEELAKRYYRLGEELYNRADYEGALKAFQHSYTYSKRPPLLYNMARCYESMGEHDRAISFYEKYLAFKPENATVIEARILNLRRLVEKKKRSRETNTTDTTNSHTQAPPGITKPQTSSKQESVMLPTQEKSVAEETVVATESRSSRHPLKTTGWILAGSGGALMITGIILGTALTASKTSELEDANAAGKEYSDYKSTEDSGRTYQKAGIATFAIGAAAAVTGVVFILLDKPSTKTERRAWLSPMPTPQGIMMSGGLRY